VGQNPSRKPNVSSSNQGISRILWKTQIYSVQTSNFIFKVHFNITLSSRNSTCNWCFCSGFSIKILYTFFFFLIGAACPVNFVMVDLITRNTRVGTLIVATIYLQLIQNRYMFPSFTVLQCSHQHCVQPVASDVEVVGYL